MSVDNDLNKSKTVQESGEFESHLKTALQRVNAPESMMQFLMLAAEAEERRRNKQPRLGRIFAFAQPQTWMRNAIGGALAAVLVVGTIFAGEHVHREHQRAAEAQREFDTATQIEDRALAHAREQMRKAGVSIEP